MLKLRKNVECWKIEAFELWCWRRLLRVPRIVRRSNQSILKEISLGCSLQGLMLKLKLQYFGHLMWRVDSLEKTHAGRDWGQEEKGMIEDEMVGWHHQLNGHGFGWTSGVGDGQGGLACCSSWGCKESYMTERLNWTENDNPHQSRKRGLTQVFHIADGFFTSWATSEAQEYWSGLPIPSPMDLPDLGVKLGFPELQVDYLPNELWGKII